MFQLKDIGCLAELPRAVLTDGETPLQAMPNLARSIKGAPLWIKRDDLTPLAMGGNKVRQLEFYFGDALEKNADTVLITGAVQSNFVRLTAAAASKLGMNCHVQLEERVKKSDDNYRNSGNVLLDRLMGATLHSYPHGEDEAGADANMELIADQLRESGNKPYVIHLGGGYPSLGALGYVVCAIEVANQIRQQNISLRGIVVPSGSGATHAGFLYGMAVLGIQIPVIGACVRRDAAIQRVRIAQHCESISSLLKMQNPVTDDQIMLDDNQLAPGYGQAGPGAMRAIRLAGSCEGLVVDPVYSSKALACALDRAKAESDSAGFLFLHTGGGPAIFAYQDEMLRAIEGV
ncbi:MAG: D-cysteine desulfhydrase family pyridoxal phosphate-dependent enzyme [Parasphingorhabdus sp.]|jgi:D-cysteine desulfhydrase family pyridoxal phosphate-dependent enzyme